MVEAIVMREWIVQGLTPILCGLALLLGVIAAGRAARASLHDRMAYRLASAGGHAKTSARVETEHRRAVLAVPISAAGKSGWRMVDRFGVLLPESTVQTHLPILLTEAAVPATTGSGWGDAQVAAAAKTAAFLQPHLAQLHLEDGKMEIIEGEILFLKPGVRIVWGHAPGQEKEEEAPAQIKLRRLLDYQKEHGGFGSLEHDVRLLAYQGHFPLSPDEPRNAVSLAGDWDRKPIPGVVAATAR